MGWTIFASTMIAPILHQLYQSTTYFILYHQPHMYMYIYIICNTLWISHSIPMITPLCPRKINTKWYKSSYHTHIHDIPLMPDLFLLYAQYISPSCECNIWMNIHHSQIQVTVIWDMLKKYMSLNPFKPY
jgi:hypothetical protein